MHRNHPLDLRSIFPILTLALLTIAGPALAQEAPSAPSSTSSEPEEPSPPPISEVDPLPEPALTGPDSEGESLSTETPYEEEREPKGVEEIIITASKRAENIQDIPLSVTALGGQTLRDAGVTTFAELQELVPNLEIIPVTDTRSTSIRIRGIGSVGSNAGIDPSVGVFIDGVYQGRAGMSVGDLLDIERVEVLRGPQGTLYGKNTAAGALNILTRRPDYEPSVYLEGVAGLYYDFQGRGYVNQPLIDDTLALRLAGYYSRRDGWDVNGFNNQDVNNVNKWGIRGKLLWDVTENLSILLNGDYSREDSRSFVPEIIDYWAGDPPGDSVMNLPFPYFPESMTPQERQDLPADYAFNADPYDFKVWANVEPKNRVDVGGLSIDTVYEWGDYSIRWLNAWRHYYTDSQFDADFSSFDGVLAYQFVDLNQFSSELTLVSPTIDLPWDTSVEFQSGLFFFYMNMDTTDRNGWEQGLVNAAQYACSPQNPAPPGSCPFPSAIFPDPIKNINFNTHETETFAAYTQAQFQLLDQLQFVAGLRFTWEKKTRSGSTDCERGNGTACPDIGLFGPPIPYRTQDFSTNRVQYRFALQYEPTENTMLYASVANGFKSGGFNQLRESATNPPAFLDETSVTGEIGARTDWFDRQLVFNLTGYFTDYDDFQAQIFDGASISIRNAGQLYSYGFESDFVYLPEQVENLRLGGALSLNIARYQRFDQAANTVPDQVALAEPFNLPAAVYCAAVSCNQDLAGRVLDNAPEWNLNLFAAYEHILPGLPAYAFGRVDYSYTSSFYLDQDLDTNLFQPGYHLLNLRAGLRTEDDFIEWTLWVTNVTNSEYLVIGFDVPLISGYAGVRAPPRLYGTTIRLRF